MFIVRVEGVEPLANRMRRYPEKWRVVLENNLQTLGRRVAYLMGLELKPVRFTGATESSVVSQVDVGTQSVSIGPTTPQSLWIRTGTRPHWAPIAPLQGWAGAKLGDPKAAWAVQKSIAKHGTSVWIMRQGLGSAPESMSGAGGFDYPGRTLERGDTQVAIINTAQRLGTDMAAWVAGA